MIKHRNLTWRIHSGVDAKDCWCQADEFAFADGRPQSSKADTNDEILERPDYLNALHRKPDLDEQIAAWFYIICFPVCIVLLLMGKL